MTPGAYARVFGSGPVGTVASLALLALAAAVARRTPELATGLPMAVRWTVALAGAAGAAAVIAWSVRALPVGDRGRRLATGGPFAWVRHPLYAAFLSLFNPALAVALDHPAYLVWAAALHPLWHLLIRPEERLLTSLFGAEYLEYAARTGRFLPRLRPGPGGGRRSGPAR
jgi:protein-S-isoprenylcysteine O-methyltransferase Ste14